MQSKLLLSATGWVSLFILLWCLILGIVQPGPIQIGSLLFFFIVAMGAAIPPKSKS